MPELRFDTLRKEWVAYATERNDRTFLPTQFCPLCPTGHGGASEVPLDSFEVVVFENRFPAFGPDRIGGLSKTAIYGSAAWECSISIRFSCSVGFS